MEVQHDDKEPKTENQVEAALTSPDSSVTRTPRRALRGRAATRVNSAAPPATSADTKGTPSEAGSGRVLRDRSTRSVPVWRRRDLGVEQKEDDEDDRDEEVEEEEEEEANSRKRRKTSCPRRRRNAETARDNKTQYENINTLNCTCVRESAEAESSESQQNSVSGDPGSGRVVCKSEPETEATCGTWSVITGRKSEVIEDEVLLGEEDPPFTDDPKDKIEDDEGASSDEEVPFKDDLNDQSYNPKSGSARLGGMRLSLTPTRCFFFLLWISSSSSPSAAHSLQDGVCVRASVESEADRTLREQEGAVYNTPNRLSGELGALRMRRHTLEDRPPPAHHLTQNLNRTHWMLIQIPTGSCTTRESLTSNSVPRSQLVSIPPLTSQLSPSDKVCFLHAALRACLRLMDKAITHEDVIFPDIPEDEYSKQRTTVRDRLNYLVSSTERLLAGGKKCDAEVLHFFILSSLSSSLRYCLYNMC
ncbi:hypothetical protein Baya_15953 [Bagarius yarrelli]|uniref:Uncharacterized protein n=1 Tax=Bagarius yarrelli TaxID=175774 RepID=A0A556VUI3_BAGYA|nr:hypothetical protein Baya_15953 [Bagarius yarrelli]